MADTGRAGSLSLAAAAVPNRLGSDGTSYFRSFLDSNKPTSSLYVHRAASPARTKSETHVKIAEAHFDFETRKTLFRPKNRVIAELYRDGFVEVYRFHKDTGKAPEMCIEKVSLLLTKVKDAPNSKSFKHGAFIFELPGGKIYTFSYNKQDIAAKDFLRMTMKLAHTSKIQYQNTVLTTDRAGRRMSDDTFVSPRHPRSSSRSAASEDGGAFDSPRRGRTQTAAAAAAATGGGGAGGGGGGGGGGGATAQDDGPLGKLRRVLQREEATYARRRISKSGDYSRFGWRGVPAEEFEKLHMSPVQVRRCRFNLKRNFNERTSVADVMLRSVMHAVQRVAPQLDEFLEKAVYTAQHRFGLDPEQFPVRLALVVDTPVLDVLFERTSAQSLLQVVNALDVIAPLADLVSGACSLASTSPTHKHAGLDVVNTAVCVIDPRHVNDDGSTSFMQLLDLFVRDAPMFEAVALIFLTQPDPAVLRQLSECAEIRARLFGLAEVAAPPGARRRSSGDGDDDSVATKMDPHVLILDQHGVRMSDSVFALNQTIHMRKLFEFTEEINEEGDKTAIPELDQFAERVVDVVMSVHEFPYVRCHGEDALAAYVARRCHSVFVDKVRENEAFWFHGMQKATSRAEMVVFGRFQDCISPLMGNPTAGFLVYQHHFDFSRAQEASDGIVRTTSFMHHAYNYATMPRELDETETRLEPLTPSVARLWAVCRDLPFLKVKNLVQGYAFAGDELMRRELEQCQPRMRMRLEQVLLACERAADMDISTTYQDLLDLQRKIVTGYALEGHRMVELPLSKVVDDMCAQLPFIEAEGGIGALLKSAVITLFLLRNDSMTLNERGELFEMASVSGADLFLPQNMPRYIMDMNHASPARNLPVSKLVNRGGDFVPFFAGCAHDALLGLLPTSVYPYVNDPPPGFEPFNPDSTLDDMIPQDLLRAQVEPMLIIVVVGGLSFNEMQEIDRLVRSTKRTVLCIAMHMVTAAMYMADIFISS